MSSPSQSSEEHQVGVTSAQENNPDPVIADLTRRMNAARHAEIHYSDATPITNEGALDELVDEFNAHARAEGSYDGRAFWEVPPRPGSILDVPQTPESQARIASLRKRIAELNEEATKGSGPVQEVGQETSHPIGAQPVPPQRTLAG